MAVEITVTETFGYNGDIQALAEFVNTALEHGVSQFRWSASPGDQRDPSQLTLTATKSR